MLGSLEIAHRGGTDILRGLCQHSVPFVYLFLSFATITKCLKLSNFIKKGLLSSVLEIQGHITGISSALVRAL
jgi:hypothetical protein